VATKLAKAFGLALRDARKKRALSLLDLSVASGVDKSYIWNLEHGRKNVSLEAVFRLSEALEVPAAELVKLTAKYLS
jgi:transcriptional regulator with XRE-family HTH domain